MKLKIDRNNSEPLYQQIVKQIRAQILSGELPDGYHLPPERRLAESLSVNRTTILNAYRELKSEGLVGSHVGKGTVVLPQKRVTEEDGQSAGTPIWNHYLSEYASGIGSQDMNDLLTLANREDIISFATGMAAPELGPIDAMQGIEHELLVEKNYQALLHSPVEGFGSLRKAVAGLMESRGCYCAPEEIMIISGSQMGIELTARIFLNSGDMVIVEEPTYFPALQIFQTMNTRIMTVPVDEHGMQTDVLEQLLKRYNPKLIYTIPTFHNPTGAEMSMERRKHFLSLIQEYKVPVLEDDAYGELCYEGVSMPTLKSMDTSGYVLYLSTFSKVIYPGLRIGWIAGNRKLIHYLASARQVIDLHTNCLSQRIIEKFIVQGNYEEHLKKICGEYKKRRDAMLRALDKYAPAETNWTRPKGGYYIWLKLPKDIPASYLFQKAAFYGVAFIPGHLFSSSGHSSAYIRLNFTFVSEKEIDKGIKVLCQAISDAAAENIERNPVI